MSKSVTPALDQSVWSPLVKQHLGLSEPFVEPGQLALRETAPGELWFWEMTEFGWQPLHKAEDGDEA